MHAPAHDEIEVNASLIDGSEILGYRIASCGG